MPPLKQLIKKIPELGPILDLHKEHYCGRKSIEFFDKPTGLFFKGSTYMPEFNLVPTSERRIMDAYHTIDGELISIFLKKKNILVPIISNARLGEEHLYTPILKRLLTHAFKPEEAKKLKTLVKKFDNKDRGIHLHPDFVNIFDKNLRDVIYFIDPIKRTYTDNTQRAMGRKAAWDAKQKEQDEVKRRELLRIMTQ